jgi:lipopolysaccharide/colanic/teichoic acid biosynthesis glycosyltransferase
MDIILSLCALIVLSPVLLILALLVRIKLGSPVIFKQKRPGLHEKIFTLYKFRTMTDKRDENGELLPDKIRLTRFGKLLRSTSLDELPELLNILKGDMSIVGPRPLLVQYLPLYNKHQKRRHDVRPGLTGLAQVNGRNAISWEEKFDLDVQYVDKIKFVSDWKIILLTVKKVFVREGINADNAATMEVFQGNGSETL